MQTLNGLEVYEAIIRPLRDGIPGELPFKDMELVSQLDMALTMARSQAPGDGMECWWELKEDIKNKITQSAMIKYGESEVLKIRKIQKGIRNPCIRIFLDSSLRDACDEIGSDIGLIFLIDSFFDENEEPELSTFRKQLISVYTAGAWPCGWRGKWPDGHMLVYLPHH